MPDRFVGLCLLPGVTAFAAPVASTRVVRNAAPRMAADSDDTPDVSDDALAKELSSTVESMGEGSEMKDFNNELYSHLNKRPEYETSEMYSALRKRQDVDDPLYSELEARRETMAETPSPNEDQTPGEVIELVLRALRDVDWPSEGHGVEVLRSYSGPASILGEEQKQEEITPEVLIEYFASSKYAILLDWVQITYLRKLELSLDKNRALQQIRLTSRAGESVPVTFQLSKHANPDGSEDPVWLIDQLLVKSIDY